MDVLLVPYAVYHTVYHTRVEAFVRGVDVHSRFIESAGGRALSQALSLSGGFATGRVARCCLLLLCLLLLLLFFVPFIAGRLRCCSVYCR